MSPKPHGFPTSHEFSWTELVTRLWSLEPRIVMWNNVPAQSPRRWDNHRLCTWRQRHEITQSTGSYICFHRVNNNITPEDIPQSPVAMLGKTDSKRHKLKSSWSPGNWILMNIWQKKRKEISKKNRVEPEASKSLWVQPYSCDSQR